MKKRVVCFMLILALLSATVLPISAIASSIDVHDAEMAFQISASPSVAMYADAEAYQEDASTASNMLISNLAIDSSQSSTAINLTVQNTQEVFEGTLYSFESGIIVGDFSPSERYNLVQLRIYCEDNCSKIYILLENVENGELLETSFSISVSEYQGLLSIADKNTLDLINDAEANDEDCRMTVYPQLFSLLQPQKQYMSMANMPALINATSSLQSSCEFESTSTYSAVAASYDNALKPFFDAFKTSNTTTASSTMDSVLCQTGWKLYKTNSYFYVMHGVQNSSTEQLVGITVVSVSFERNESQELLADICVTYSYTLSYNKSTNTATVLQSDSGIRLEDVITAIELVYGTTNFYQTKESHKLEGTNSVLGLLVALADDLNVNIPSTVFSVLELVFNNTVKTTEYQYLGTDTAQMQRYGSLVRAVASETGSSSYLWGQGTKFGITGQYRSDKTYVSSRFSYSFTAYSLL